MLRDALSVSGKDLLIEGRSRVLTNHVLPFAALVVVLFGFALGPERRALQQAAPGLFWVTVLFVGLLAVQRSFSLEGPSSELLRMSGMDPGGIFIGKSVSIALQLLVLELVLTGGVVLVYGAHVHSWGYLIASAIIGALGIASAGTIYGALSATLRMRELLMPLLLLPIVSPVLLAGTRLWQAALGTTAGASVDPWMRLLTVFAAVYMAIGVVLFGPLMEIS